MTVKVRRMRPFAIAPDSRARRVWSFFSITGLRTRATIRSPERSPIQGLLSYQLDGDLSSGGPAAADGTCMRINYPPGTGGLKLVAGCAQMATLVSRSRAACIG